MFAASLVAEQLGIRWASCVLAPWQFLSAYDPSVIGAMPLFALLREAGVTVNRAMKELGRRQTKSWAEPIYELRKELALLPLAATTSGISPGSGPDDSLLYFSLQRSSRTVKPPAR